MNTDIETRILVIDSEEYICECFRQLLENSGVGVVAVTSSDEALALLRQEEGEVDLIIQDCLRPLGRCLGGPTTGQNWDSGIQFDSRYLSREFPDVPVVYCTGFLSSYVHGVFPQRPVLRKPFNREQLLDCVRTHAKQAA